MGSSKSSWFAWSCLIFSRSQCFVLIRRAWANRPGRESDQARPDNGYGHDVSFLTVRLPDRTKEEQQTNVHESWVQETFLSSQSCTRWRQFLSLQWSRHHIINLR